MSQPPLKSLHPESSLSRAKMDHYSKLTTRQLTHLIRIPQAGITQGEAGRNGASAPGKIP